MKTKYAVSKTTGLYFDGINFSAKTTAAAKKLPASITTEDMQLVWGEVEVFEVESTKPRRVLNRMNARQFKTLLVKAESSGWSVDHVRLDRSQSFTLRKGASTILIMQTLPNIKRGRRAVSVETTENGGPWVKGARAAFTAFHRS